MNNCLLGERKNCNLPGIQVDLPVLQDKDKDDLVNFGIVHAVDFVAASFVQTADDVKFIRETLGLRGRSIKIISKIENEAGVKNFAAIAEASDGIMVARGDLGMEIPPENVFVAQKMMISHCNRVGKPVITATQMLESMCSAPRPTRAECSDVANAVLDGADAVMLSGETAIGEFAVEAVAIQRRVIEAAESEALMVESVVLEKNTPSESDAVMASAATLAQDVGASALVCFTGSGKSIEGLTPLRPSVPVLAVCPCLETARALTLFRGVYGTSDQDAQMLAGRVEIQGNYAVRFSEGLEVACRLARDKGLTPLTTDRLVVVARLPLFSQGALNTVRLVGAMGPGIADGYGPEDRGLTSFSEGDSTPRAVRCSFW